MPAAHRLATLALHRQARSELPAVERPIVDALIDSLEMTADGTVASVRVKVAASLIEERLRECTEEL